MCGYSIYDDCSESEKEIPYIGSLCGGWPFARKREGYNGKLEQEVPKVSKTLVRLLFKKILLDYLLCFKVANSLGR